MMNKRVKFAQLDAVLEEMGFRMSVVSGLHVSYRHPALQKPILLRVHKPRDFVPDFELAYVRHELEWQGIMESAIFEEKLMAVAA